MADQKGANGTGEKKTLVEEGTELKGSLKSNCPIVVRGTIEGEVDAPTLTVSSSGAVRGKAKVGTIRSEGELAGEFDADTVQLSGRVRDNTVIRAKSLEVKLAPENARMQVIFGECSLDVGEAPSKEDAVAPAKVEREEAARAEPSDEVQTASGKPRRPTLRPPDRIGSNPDLLESGLSAASIDGNGASTSSRRAHR